MMNLKMLNSTHNWLGMMPDRNLLADDTDNILKKVNHVCLKGHDGFGEWKKYNLISSSVVDVVVPANVWDMNDATNGSTIQVRFGGEGDECETNPIGEGSAKMKKDPNSGEPIEIKIPIGSALYEGDCFRWPMTESTTACMENGKGCESVKNHPQKSKIDCTYKGGHAWIYTQEAGGYYQVDSKSDIPVIAGLTTVCAILLIGLVLSAFHFRKNPESWEKLKNWGPEKIKLIKQSTASQV